MSTNLASVRSWAGVAALAGHQPTRVGIAGGVVDALRFLVAAVGVAGPAHVLAAARYERFGSRGEAGFADRVRFAMRTAFGGGAGMRVVS